MSNETQAKSMHAQELDKSRQCDTLNVNFAKEDAITRQVIDKLSKQCVVHMQSGSKQKQKGSA